MPIQPRNTILIGDAAKELAGLPAAWVDCVVTSPPYYLQRDYGIAAQLGLEDSVHEWVRGLRQVFGQVARVLQPSGALWLNLGDSYSRRPASGAPTKGLLLAPERLLLALARDGWIVRNKVIWAKTTPMPSGVADRLEASYDLVYLLVRSRRYHFDLDAIRERHPATGFLGRNPSDVWHIPTAKFGGPHFATFHPQLVERPLLATCPARVCIDCGAAWKTQSTRRYVGAPVRFARDRYVRRHPVRYRVIRRDPRLRPGCRCKSATRPGIVLDPFFGTGTVGEVAERHGRDWLGIEINPAYAELAWRRVRQLPWTRPEP